jgi:hypothetical protein
MLPPTMAEHFISARRMLLRTITILHQHREHGLTQ